MLTGHFQPPTCATTASRRGEKGTRCAGAIRAREGGQEAANGSGDGGAASEAAGEEEEQGLRHNVKGQHSDS